MDVPPDADSRHVPPAATTTVVEMLQIISSTDINGYLRVEPTFHNRYLQFVSGAALTDIDIK